jgi:beta-lactamase class D
VVDYNARSDSYRVVGDVSLLARRYTPGSTFRMFIAAVALDSGERLESVERTLPEAQTESGGDFYSQALKRTGYEPIRKFLVEAGYTPAVPDAVGSFADLVRGEPLRVTVFEQNLFLQAFQRRSLPLRLDTCEALERWLVVDGMKRAWGKSGLGEVSAESPRYVSWFNGVARLSDGLHVITVAVLTDEAGPAGLERFRRYLSRRFP